MMNNNTPTPSEFFDQCERHDWYCDFSDDHRVWQNGVTSLGKLKLTAGKSTKLQEIYDAWEKHIWSGKAFGKPEVARPQKEMFI
jgi:hypothetical protein